MSRALYRRRRAGERLTIPEMHALSVWHADRAVRFGYFSITFALVALALALVAYFL